MRDYSEEEWLAEVEAVVERLQSARADVRLAQERLLDLWRADKRVSSDENMRRKLVANLDEQAGDSS